MGSLHLHCSQTSNTDCSLLCSFLDGLSCAFSCIFDLHLSGCPPELHPCILQLLFVPGKEHFAWDWTSPCFSIPPLPFRPLIWVQFSMARWHYDPSTIDKMKKIKEIKNIEGMCRFWQRSFIRWWSSIHQGCLLLPRWPQSSCGWLSHLHSGNCRQVQVRVQRAELFISVYSISSTSCSETVLAMACVAFYLWAFCTELWGSAMQLPHPTISEFRYQLCRTWENAPKMWILPPSVKSLLHTIYFSWAAQFLVPSCHFLRTSLMQTAL